ncbi:MAG: glycine cleavage system aminomethyltransferase GcvT [Pirellulales bacterium]
MSDSSQSMPVTPPLLKTPLHAWHAAHGGRMVDFAGWSMPVQYGSIVAEHVATRGLVTLFDVSHMGRLIFSGPNALAFLDTLVTRRVADLKPGQIRYGLLTNDDGFCLDDILVYAVPAATDAGPTIGPREAYALMVVNASNREKALAWIKPRLVETTGVTLTDVTTDVAMIAVQGPQAMGHLDAVCTPDASPLKYYTCQRAVVQGVPALVSRTGYTGEDGCELMVPSADATATWEVLIRRGATPAGLAARDTLRLEAAMPLYGHELNEETTPIEAGLDFAVTMKDRKFPGSRKLAAEKAEGVSKIRIGLTVEGKRPPREHYAIFATETAEDAIGTVTSGTLAPTLQTGIAMGYVPPAYADLGKTLWIDLRGTRIPATVVKLPFYKRPEAK